VLVSKAMQSGGLGCVPQQRSQSTYGMLQPSVPEPRSCNSYSALLYITVQHSNWLGRIRLQ
jgi:hypothetical protein